VRRLSIPARIFLAFAIVLTSFSAMAVSSVLQHDHTASRLRLLHDGYLPLAIRLGLAKSQQAVRRQQLERVAAGNTWVRGALRARAEAQPATLRRLEHHLDRAEELAGGETETLRTVREALERVEREHEATLPDYQELTEALELGEVEDVAPLVDRLKRREEVVARQYDLAYLVLQERIGETGLEAAERERSAATILGLLALLSLMLGLMATWWSQRVLKPLPQLQERVGAVAAGDLRPGRIATKGDDELATLARDFEKMVEALANRDRRLAELRTMQAQILADLRAGVVVVDAKDQVRTVNAAATRVLGVDEETGSLDAIFEQVAELREVLANVRESGTPVGASAVAFGRRALDVLVSPFGAGDELLVVVDDVTDALETKERLIRSERLAAIGRMAAHVTHEVRNPLSSIGLNVELLEDELEEEDDEARALLRAIQKEIDRLTAITEEYLRLARLPQPNLTPEDPAELVAEVAHFVSLEMKRAEVELELELDAVPLVAMDESQLRQALLNLLRNAREAQEPQVAHGEAASITLRVRREGDVVVVEVEDRGPGIASDARDHIFDLFYSTKERGSGLGLALTQQIVAAHAGTIECLEAEGGGTRFELRFPVDVEPSRAHVA